MPDVLKLNAEMAMVKITQAHLFIGKVEEQHNLPESYHGKVVKTDPKAKEIVELGTDVMVKIGKKKNTALHISPQVVEGLKAIRSKRTKMMKLIKSLKDLKVRRQ
jgi:beta-lactam-binding protein with PASTA domain